MRPILFIDRDGVILKEPAIDFQIDSLEKMEFVPGVISALAAIRKRTDYYLVMVSNQDGMGTASFPEETFWPVQQKMLKTLRGEGVIFDAIHIDPTMPEDQAWTRKPGTGMLEEYIANEQGLYDLSRSFVIGDRPSDIELARNIGCPAIWMAGEGREEELRQAGSDGSDLSASCRLISDDWNHISAYLIAKGTARRASLHRKTRETDVMISLDLDGTGESDISTGLHFFDHMLDQLARHSGCDLTIRVTGDLEVDEHHTIEDTAITLGQAYLEALGDKRGISRYGFLLPMDDSLAQVAIDFSGRPWLVWDVVFDRERVGDVPTEMFYHFFKSFCDEARCNLNIAASGNNAHHIIEAVFKGFARAIKGAVARDFENMRLPSTKGSL
jgi:imidazoleglycerol-phosphate dehydratase / histidinol-phosphatase